VAVSVKVGVNVTVIAGLFVIVRVGVAVCVMVSVGLKVWVRVGVFVPDGQNSLKDTSSDELPAVHVTVE